MEIVLPRSVCNHLFLLQKLYHSPKKDRFADQKKQRMKTDQLFFVEPKKKFVRSKLTSYCNFKKILVPLNVFLVFRAKLVNHSPDYIIRILARSKARENLRTKFSERLAPKLPRQAHTHPACRLAKNMRTATRCIFRATLALFPLKSSLASTFVRRFFHENLPREKSHRPN